MKEFIRISTKLDWIIFIKHYTLFNFKFKCNYFLLENYLNIYLKIIIILLFIYKYSNYLFIFFILCLQSLVKFKDTFFNKIYLGINLN